MSGIVGEVRMFAADFVPPGWLPCTGGPYSIATFGPLFSVIGTTFGGDGVTTFAVPDLRGSTPLGAGSGPDLTTRSLGERGGSETVALTVNEIPPHQHSVLASAAEATETAPGGNTWAVTADAAPYAAPPGSATLAHSALGPAGSSAPHENRSPVLALSFGVCAEDEPDGAPTLGEIRLWAGTAPPSGWFECAGGLLSIAANQALFSLLGTTYGGNGMTTFQLPDLRGRVPVHAGGTTYLGQAGGAERVTLTTSQIPGHTHTAYGSSAAATESSPAGAMWATAGRPQYGPAAQVAAAPTHPTGGGQSHPNMPPYVAMSFIIAGVGIYPSWA